MLQLVILSSWHLWAELPDGAFFHALRAEHSFTGANKYVIICSWDTEADMHFRTPHLRFAVDQNKP